MTKQSSSIHQLHVDVRDCSQVSDRTAVDLSITEPPLISLGRHENQILLLIGKSILISFVFHLCITRPKCYRLTVLWNLHNN